MILSKLTRLATAIRLINKNVLFPRPSKYHTTTLLKHKSEKSTSKKDEIDEDLDKPIVFSNSAAANWNAAASRTGGEVDDRPWFQTYVVLASTAAFLIYFLVLREENDIDQKLTMELSDHFEGERKKNLIMSQQLPKEHLATGKIK